MRALSLLFDSAGLHPKAYFRDLLQGVEIKFETLIIDPGKMIGNMPHRADGEIEVLPSLGAGKRHVYRVGFSDRTVLCLRGDFRS